MPAPPSTHPTRLRSRLQWVRATSNNIPSRCANWKKDASRGTQDDRRIERGARLKTLRLSTGSAMLIELENVTKTYGKVSALRGLSVALPEGAIGLLGPNGAGKTTMIRTLLGLIAIDSGQGRVLGMDIRSQRLAIRQACGFVPEDECLFPGMIGVVFVAYAGELVGMGSKDALQRAHEVLDYVGLGEARYRRVESYSSGMKQRLKIASAIVHDPRLLILDEPTNGMDPGGGQETPDPPRAL